MDQKEEVDLESTINKMNENLFLSSRIPHVAEEIHKKGWDLIHGVARGHNSKTITTIFDQVVDDVNNQIHKNIDNVLISKPIEINDRFQFMDKYYGRK